MIGSGEKKKNGNRVEERMGAEEEETGKVDLIFEVFIKASKKGVEAGGSRETSRTKGELFFNGYYTGIFVG